jgi:hypothetical protein
MKNMRVLNISPELKFKKIRQVAENQLGQNLYSIEKNCAVQKDKLDQSIKLVKKQLENLELENRPGLAIPRITSSSLYGRLSVTPESRESVRCRSSCIYGILRHRQCPFFPCKAPVSYHTIGYRLEPDDTTWVSWKKKKNELNEYVRESMENSTLLNSGTSRLRAERREEILRKEMKRRRKLQLKEKPPLWETNYGKPTPIRRIKYPVRLMPLNYE